MIAVPYVGKLQRKFFGKQLLEVSMMRNALYGILVLSAIVAGFVLGQHRSGVLASGTSRRVLYYVDPMHPAYKSDRPGIAPDCGMQLEPVYADEGVRVADSGAPTQSIPGAVHIDSERQQLIGIRVAAVEKTVRTRTVRVPGRVTADETRVYRVNVGVDGFVRETHEDALGSQVKKDQRLAIIYSPEFLSSIGGYVSALEHPPGGATAGNQGLAGIQSWADRLRSLGMSDTQVKEIDLTRTIPQDIYVLSPADGFIVSRNISAVARITLPNLERSFSARVSNILPQIDPSSRTLKLRLEADNRDFALRPDMFVDVDLAVATPPGLSVPADAVLDSGLSRRVFVVRGNGIFEPRQVDTGEPYGDRVQILKGLAVGEKVVASGTFLLDSESRLRLATERAH